MDHVRLGAALRALRIRRGWRQVDLATRAGVTRDVVGIIERGFAGRVTIEDVGRVAAGLGATVDIGVRWRGERLDRLLDEAHAATVDAVVRRLRRDGWEARVEVSFSIWGERGSIDVLAWHQPTRTILVVEAKSVIPDLQSLVHALDRKARLAPRIAGDRGWTPSSTARLVAIADSPTSRARVRRHGDLVDSAFAVRGGAVRSWLRAPSGAISGLLFLSNASPDRTTGPIWRRERVRARRRGPAAAEHTRMRPVETFDNDLGVVRRTTTSGGP